MSEFLEFYQMGGFFNNFVSLFALAGVASLVMHVVGPKRGQDDARLLNLVDRLAGLGLASGVLGTLFNYIEYGHALATVGPDVYVQASHMGASIVVITLAWALMCAIPLWVASTCLRFRLPAEAR